MIDLELLLEALEERREVLGSLRGDGFPLTWSEVAAQVNTHQATFSRIKAGQAPGPRTLQRVLKWLGATEDQFEACSACGDSHDFAAIGNSDLPVADRDEEWDGGNATARIFEKATDKDGKVDVGFVSQAFLWRDPEEDPNFAESYKLPFADIKNGNLTIYPRAVAAVASGHGLAQADVPESDVKAIEEKICSLYTTVRKKYEDWPQCPYDKGKDGTGGDLKSYSPEARERMAKEGTAMPDGSFPIADCEDLRNAIQAFGRAKDKNAAKAHIKKRKKALGCEDVDLPEGWSLEQEEEMDPEEQDCSCDPEDENFDPECECDEEQPEGPKTAAIIGRGRLSESKDDRTMSLVARVQELLAEGAVGVSIRHDLDPNDMPSREQIQALMENKQFEELDALMSSINARPRHLAIVDTAAFSNARLTLGKDGFEVEGPITFEGIWTGDVRDMPYGGLVWDDELLPIPIIWDPDNNDHDGVVVGYISELERVDGMTTGVRPEAVEAEEVEAVVAAAGSDRLPAHFFERFSVQGEMPLTISEPDEHGLRRVFGHAVPHGVCHRSDMSPCFQYPGDVDPGHKGFHTGSPVTLSDGSTIRVGALTMGGNHINTALARQGVTFRDVNRHREDSNKVFAMVRAWEDRYGLAVSGVVLPGVSRKDLLAAQACAPSVEIWPKGSGRTLVGIHLVPTPAWPVAASAGNAEYQTMASSIEVLGDLSEPEPEVETDRLALVEASLSRIEKALAVVFADALADVPMPDDAPLHD